MRQIELALKLLMALWRDSERRAVENETLVTSCFGAYLDLSQSLPG